MPAIETANEVDEHYQTYTHLDTDTLREVIEQHIDELHVLEKRERLQPLKQIREMSKSVSKRLEAAIKVYLDRTELE